jgi:hypothetical protein
VPVFAVRPKLRIRGLDTPPGDDRLRFVGVITVPTSPTIDPATHGVRILLDNHGTTMLDAMIPGGSLWRTNSAHTACRYRNPSDPHGLYKVQLKLRRHPPGTLRYVVRGKGGDFTIPASDTSMRGTVVIDAPIARTGQCGEALFDIGQCVRNPAGSVFRCR